MPQLYDDNDSLIYDPAKAEFTQVMARVGGDYQPVLAVAQTQQVALDSFTWDGVTYRRGQEIPEEVLKAIEKAPEGSPPQPVGQMRAVQTPDSTFYGVDMPDGSIGWYRNRVPRNLNIPALPAPYTGPAENAQTAFTKLGLDPTGRSVLDNAVATGNRVSMRAYDRFAGEHANIQRATSDIGFEQPSPSRVVNPGARIGTGSYNIPSPVPGFGHGTNKPTLTMAQTLSAVRGDTSPIENIRHIGQSLGLRGLGERQQLRGRFTPIDKPVIRRPNVRAPNVDVAGLRAMAARLKRMAATRRDFSLRTNEQLQDARNQGSGGFV